MRSLTMVVTALAVLSCARAAAAAPTREGCVSANEDAEALRRRGALRAARVSLLACSAVECPKIVRDDCVARLEEVDAATPTVVFTAVENGVPVTDVVVGFDRKTLADHLYAEALPVDPGEHVFTFEKKGWPIQTRTITLTEKEKNRREAIVFGSATVPITQGHLVVTSEPSAAITVDGLPPVSGRYDGMVTAGKHELRVTRSGKKPFTKSVEVKIGETQTVNAALEDERSLTPWIIGGGVIVVIAVVVVGGILISSSGNDATARPGSTATGLSIATF